MPRLSVALRVLVVNEPELDEAINRLRGEWAERAGGELSASAASWADIAAAKSLDADVVIFPSRYLGELCVRNWLRPVRAAVLKNVNSADFFPLVRNELIKWGGDTMALPLGIEPTAIVPPAFQRPALWLLAHAAPNAISNERLGVLFEAETMKPRITESAFDDALTKLDRSFSESSGIDKSTALVSERDLPLLGYGDRLIAVTASSRNAATAFKLIEWLAQPDISSQFARAGNEMYPVRVSLASSPDWYFEKLTATERAGIAKRLVAELSGEKCLLIPRIPGIDEYLAALGDAAKSAVIDRVPPQEALQAAAERWEQITDSHGREAQRRAYLKHLGINEP
jgi:hypothetical protein